MATKQSQIRLTDVDKANIEAVREYMGLLSASATIRYAIARIHREIQRDKARIQADEASRNHSRGLGLD